MNDSYGEEPVRLKNTVGPVHMVCFENPVAVNMIEKPHAFRNVCANFAPSQQATFGPIGGGKSSLQDGDERDAAVLGALNFKLQKLN